MSNLNELAQNRRIQMKVYADSKMLDIQLECRVDSSEELHENVNRLHKEAFIRSISRLSESR